MQRHIISVSSITYAIKGRDLLRKNGYKANIERVSGEKALGCGYAILLEGVIETAEELLRQNNVKILDITQL